MVEQTDADERHSDAVFVACLDDIVVADGASCLCDVLHSTLVCALDVVAEGEESVAAESYSSVAGYPFFLLFARQRFRLLLEEELPSAFAEHVIIVVGDVDINSIVAVGAAYSVDKG